MGPFADLTDVPLADEDINSILSGNANRAIQGNLANQVTQPGGQICNKCNWCHFVDKFGTGAIWWPTLQLMQV